MTIKQILDQPYSFVLAAMLFVIFFLLVAVPRFELTYLPFGRHLPLVTASVFAISRWANLWPYTFFVGMIAPVIIVYKYPLHTAKPITAFFLSATIIAVLSVLAPLLFFSR